MTKFSFDSVFSLVLSPCGSRFDVGSISGGVARRSTNKTWKEKRKEGWWRLPGGPVNVLTVYPQHSTVVAAACHSQIPSRDPFTSASLLLSLSRFVFLCSLSLSPSSHFFFSLIHPTNPSLLSLLPSPLSSFQEETAKENERREREKERESSCYAVCLPPHPDLPLRFLSSSKG